LSFENKTIGVLLQHQIGQLDWVSINSTKLYHLGSVGPVLFYIVVIYSNM